MFKIDKCIQITRRLFQFQRSSWLQKPFHVGSRNANNPSNPPSYDCKQPEKDDEDEKLMEKLKKRNINPMFKDHCPKDYKTYKKAFFFVCIPVILCMLIDIVFLEEQHRKRQIFIEWEYMRIRNKEYPWDPVRTLFHNPRYNALPKGYEVSVPEEEEYDPRLPV